MDRVEAIKDRLEKATPGPWEVGRQSGEPYVRGDKGGTTVMLFAPCQMEDAELIAHAPEDIRFLLEENKRLREALERIAAERPLTGPLNLTDLDMQEIARQALSTLQAEGEGDV